MTFLFGITYTRKHLISSGCYIPRHDRCNNKYLKYLRNWWLVGPDYIYSWMKGEKERKKGKKREINGQLNVLSVFRSSDHQIRKIRGPTIISSRSWCRFKLRILPPSPFQNRFPLIPKKRIISPLFCIKSFPKNLVAAHSNSFYDGSFYFFTTDTHQHITYAALWFGFSSTVSRGTYFIEMKEELLKYKASGNPNITAPNKWFLKHTLFDLVSSASILLNRWWPPSNLASDKMAWTLCSSCNFVPNHAASEAENVFSTGLKPIITAGNRPK